MNNICQSCGDNLLTDNLGTNVDGSSSFTYCINCFANGEFTEDLTLEELVKGILDEYEENEAVSKEELYQYAVKFLPTLTRWKN